MKQKPQIRSSVEETALAVESLITAADARISSDGLAISGDTPAAKTEAAIARGLMWLTTAVEENRHTEPSPIGFYFAKLWYYEKLYPLTFTASALGQAVGPFASPTERKVEHAHR
jgi:squalene-hopene/tetraprenyl-beta-curcumene cyclase